MRRTSPGALALALCFAVAAAASAQVRSPSQFLRVDVGADRTLADYRQITSYFEHLAAQSPRVELDTMGTTTNGNPFIMAVISTPKNLANRARVGTPYEGGSMPWLYHVYTGHDNNRDWYMLTQKETRAMTRTAYKEWHPHVWLDGHQMGSSGPRLFVPPYADPITPSISPLMWRGINLIGSNMAWRLQQQGKSGVATQYSFDAYYPGSVDSNAEFKNVFSLIIEAASARIVLLPSASSAARAR